MVTRQLRRGEILELSCLHTYPLEMSAHGGTPAGRVLNAEAGTRVKVTQDCGPHIFHVPFYFTEGQLEEYRRGMPFQTPRGCLNEVAAAPG